MQYTIYIKTAISSIVEPRRIEADHADNFELAGVIARDLVYQHKEEAYFVGTEIRDNENNLMTEYSMNYSNIKPVINTVEYRKE